jgi:hypothetical protein
MSDSTEQYAWKNVSPVLYTDGVDIFAADMTPEVASELLGHNPKNRTISAKNTGRIMRQVEKGEWKFNGDAIRITADGKLIDGQHRALACINANTSIRVLVVHGVPAEVQDTIDTGRPRTLADILAIRGYTNTNALSVVLRGIYTRENAALERCFEMAGPVARLRWTNAELLAFLNKNEERVLDLVKVSTSRSDKIPYMPRSVTAVLTEEFEDASYMDADEFWHRLTTGIADSADEACFVLRRTLQREADKHDREGRSNVWVAALTIKAWNAYLQGRPVNHLRMIRGGSPPEAFPSVLTRAE